MALKKQCGRSGCRQLVDIGISYCDKHQQEFEERQRQRHREYKQSRADKMFQEFYVSKEWLRTRDYVKSKFNGICLYSFYVLGKVVPCDTVHHIVELKDVGGWGLRLDIKNLIPLSESIHQEIHGLYKTGNKEQVQELLRKLRHKYISEYCN